MKRFISLIIVLSMLLFTFVGCDLLPEDVAGLLGSDDGDDKDPEAPELDSWTCSCGNTCTGKFCSECGAIKPEEKDPATVPTGTYYLHYTIAGTAVYEYLTFDGNQIVVGMSNTDETITVTYEIKDDKIVITYEDGTSEDLDFELGSDYLMLDGEKWTSSSTPEPPTGDSTVPNPPVDDMTLEEAIAKGYDGSAVTIRFSHTMGEAYRNVLNRHIKRFNEIYPNITIEHSQIGSYDDVRDQILTELAVGQQPNIAYCYPDHVATYNLAHGVVSLDQFIESSTLGLTDAQLADFIPAYYNEGRIFDVAGTMYTLPMSKSTEVLYYNKSFFEMHNLTVPITWAEMEALCQKILEIDPDCIPLGYDSESNWFITMCEQFDSPYTSLDKNNHFLYNNETNRNFVRVFKEWFDKGYFTTQQISEGYVSNLFTQNYCYMGIGSTGGARYWLPASVNNEYPFEVGVAPIPQVDPENPKAISQGPSLCIFNSANKQEIIASWLFMKFLATDAEFQAEFSMISGYMPVVKSALEHPVYQEFLAKANNTHNIQALAVKVGLEMADYYYVSPAFYGSSTAREKVGELMLYCFNNNPASSETVDEFIKKAFEASVKACNDSM